MALVAAVVTAVIGALVSDALSRRLNRRERQDRRPQSWTQVNVHVGDVNLHVGDVNLHVGDEHERRSLPPVDATPPARQAPHRPSPRRAPAAAGPRSDSELLALVAVFVFGAASVLLSFHGQLVVGIIIGTGVLAGALLGTFGYLLASRALTGWEWTAFLVSSMLVLAGGAMSAVALDSPRLANYEQLLLAHERGGIAAVIERFGSDGVFFVVYQLLGVATLAVAMLAVLMALLFLIARINFASNARGQWLWRRLAGLSLGHGRPVTLLVGSVVFTAFSYVLVSGVFFNFVNESLMS